MKVVWSSAWTACGAQFVVVDGTELMLGLFAGNEDFLQQVHTCTSFLPWMFNHCMVYNTYSYSLCVISGAVPTNSSVFGQGTSLIALSNLRCSGNELMLRSCPSGSVSECSHIEDVGVRCQLRTGETQLQSARESWQCLSKGINQKYTLTVRTCP